jgi:hypothetical protein
MTARETYRTLARIAERDLTVTTVELNAALDEIDFLRAIAHLPEETPDDH